MRPAGPVCFGWMLLLATVASSAERPNIIFFLSDDHRGDMLGCAGHPILKTPNLDRLAKDGVRFENAFVTTSICAASRATVFTGMYERTHKYTFGTPPIASQHVAESYPTLLKDGGYRTGFIGKFGVSVKRKDREGMFDYFAPLNRNPYFKSTRDGRTRHVTEIAGDRAIQFLRSQPEDQPFCLSVSFNAAHAEDGDKVNHFPWPKAVDGMYDDIKVPAPRLSESEVFVQQPEFLRQSLNRVRWFWRWDTPAKYQRNLRAYYRMISGLDRVIGRVLAELKTRGQAKNTIVIFCGDNGYYAGSRGFAGKWSHYEESLRVPLIVYDPRLPTAQRGQIRREMALNVDIAPTVLAAAGVKIPPDFQGRSLLPLIQPGQQQNWRREFFCEHLFDHPAIPKWEGVRGERWVYARYFQQQPAYEFLHDLKGDPDQRRNLAHDPKHADTLAQLQRRCNALREKFGGPYTPEKFPTIRRQRQARQKKKS